MRTFYGGPWRTEPTPAGASSSVQCDNAAQPHSESLESKVSWKSYTHTAKNYNRKHAYNEFLLTTKSVSLPLFLLMYMYYKIIII